MKKSLKFIVLGLILGISVPAFIGTFKVSSASGYSASSLPTTIDLNDTSASNIRSYYSSLNNLSQSERQGSNLLKNLKPILKNNQQYYGYDSTLGNAIWKIYEIADRDWKKSPASEIEGYNASTNTITGYQYGESAAKPGTNPYIHALYVDRSAENYMHAWSIEGKTETSHGNNKEWGIDREHIWAKSQGFNDEGGEGARGDPMHLWPGDSDVNSSLHNKHMYGYVENLESAKAGKWSYGKNNHVGTSLTLGTSLSTEVVFEPQDSDKGDIARAIFYMVARYNDLAGGDIVNSDFPNLELVQSNEVLEAYTSSTTVTGKMGIMTDLLNWHHADPVDEFEIHRNNLLYTNFTNNRNPFVDFPEWVDFIWGTATYNGKQYQSYSSTPTGYATPSSDTINGYNGGGSDPVSVTGVTLNTNSATITVGSSEVLSATVLPNNATNQNVTWSSSNTSVATVSAAGRVTAVAEGNATITVTTSDGGFTATCAVAVTASGGGGGGDSPVNDTLCAKGFGGYTTSSYSAAGIDYTGVANLTNNSDATYALQVFIGSTGQVRGNQSGSANFSARNTTTYTDYYISEVSLTVDSGGTLDGSTTDRSVVWFGSSAYANPTTAPSTGTKVAASPASSGQSTLTWTNSNTAYNYFILYDLKAASAPKSKDADTPLTITWSPVSSSSKALDSITLDTSDAPTTFNVGDTFSYEGLSVTAYYDDGTDDIVTPTNVSTPDMSTAGQKTVTVSYEEDGVTKTAQYSITVNSNPSISWTAPTINVYSGSTLNGSDVNGWAVTYNDGAGHQTVLTYSQLTVKLGGTTISIPHTWSASDDGKTLTATYNSLTTTASSAVQVTQSVNTITMETEPSVETSNLTFTAACGGGGTADDGASWAITSDAAESTFDSTKGIHYGTGSAAVEYIQLVSNSFTSGTITQVVVNASGASGVTGSVSVTVGGNQFGETQSFNATATDKTFTGSASAGQIVVRIYKASAAVKAIYCKSIAVTYTAPGTSTVISNSLDHISAQRAAVRFANAFNAAMATTNNCTTNLSSVWTTCSSAYDTFKSEAAALGSTEEAYAKNLIKYATAQYSDDSGEACIERMMKTYEVCVNKHGMTAFMSELITVSRPVVPPVVIATQTTNNVTIIVIVSLIGLTAIGGHFYLRKKKHE